MSMSSSEISSDERWRSSIRGVAVARAARRALGAADGAAAPRPLVEAGGDHA